tara:strand:- start:5970 stop:7094 length:1125 start_codon:yes stop_codon:yes gene_type:complete
MKVAYFSDTFARKERFGLARFAHCLFTELKILDVDAVPISAISDFDNEHPEWLSASGFRRLRIPRRYLATLWSLIRLPRLEWFYHDFDLLHSVDIDYPVATNLPWVVTVHDLGPITHPEFFSNARPWLYRSLLKQISKRADAVICVSETTAQAVRDNVPTSLGNRLKVVPEGVEDYFFEAADLSSLTPLSLPPGTPFFLFSGSLNPRKNLVRAIRAFAKAADQIPHHIFIASSGGWEKDELLAEIASSPIAHRIHQLGYVSDEQLHALYTSADGYLYVSLFEGFGLPILEAMASQCPVITSNLSSMPEIAGNAALLVDPYNEDDIAAAIVKLASDKTLAQHLRSAGLARAREFNWKKCAQRMTDIYAEVLEARS